MNVQECPALGELDGVLANLSPELSSSYRDRMRWVRGEIATALDYGAMPPTACASLADLLSPVSLSAYCDAADQGMLRRPDRRLDGPPSMHSAYSRRGALKRLARAIGRRLVVPPVLVDERERDDVSPAQERALWAHVATIPEYSPPHTAYREKALRLAAVVAVTLDTRARLGELVAMTTEDLDPDLTHLTVHRQPPSGPACDETLPLSPRTRAVLRQWLPVRAALVDRLAGTPPTALWVTVAPGGHARVPGLPLSADRLTECYRMAVWALNEERQADPSWVLLPHRLGALRTARKAGPAGACGSGATGHNKAATAA